MKFKTLMGFNFFCTKKEVKMKFLALRNFHYTDKKTGKLVSISKEDILELGLEDIEQIDAFIRDLAITPLDDTLIKNNARYRVLYPFKIEFDGEVVTGEVRDEIKLSRDIATRLLAQGYIRPVNEDSWYPGKRSFIAEQTAKKMYDDLEEEVVSENNKAG
jgi:hypothetical protein